MDEGRPYIILIVHVRKIMSSGTFHVRVTSLAAWLGELWGGSRADLHFRGAHRPPAACRLQLIPAGWYLEPYRDPRGDRDKA